MVFGLALSLGAFVLISEQPASSGQLYAVLLMFAFSFVILVTVWYNYTMIMGLLPLETHGLVVLNLVLLFVVVIEPYLLNVVAFHIAESVGEPASVLYAVDLAAMNAILAAFLHLLSREERPVVPPAALRGMRIRRNFTIATAVLFLVSTLPVFWSWAWLPGIPSRVVLWLFTLPAGWGVRLMLR